MAARKWKRWLLSAACVVGLSACHPISACGIGPLSAGMPTKKAEQAGWKWDTAIQGPGCGYLYTRRAGDSHVRGVANKPGNVLWVETSDASDKTDPGVGPGSTFAALKRAYPGKLIVNTSRFDRQRGSRAIYSPMVMLRQGDIAITFKMDGVLNQPLKNTDRVKSVKVSSWAYRGDDEGCL